MWILHNAVERKERTVARLYRIIITYDEETPTGSWVACLCRGEYCFFPLSLFLEPEEVRPHRAKTVAECLFDFPIACQLRSHAYKFKNTHTSTSVSSPSNRATRQQSNRI